METNKDYIRLVDNDTTNYSHGILAVVIKQFSQVFEFILASFEPVY